MLNGAVAAAVLFVCVYGCCFMSCYLLLLPLQVFAEGDEEDEDGDADEPPAHVPVVKLRGKKVSTAQHRAVPVGTTVTVTVLAVCCAALRCVASRLEKYLKKK